MYRWIGMLLLVLLMSTGTVTAAPAAIGEAPPEFPLYATALAPDRETFSIVRIDDPFGDAEPVFITDDTRVDLSPLPSHDGRYLLFKRRTLGASDVFEWYILDLDCVSDCPPRILPDEVQGLQEIRWSPVTTQFVGWMPLNHSWVFDVESWSYNQVGPGNWTAYPTWSPDGSHLIVASELTYGARALTPILGRASICPRQDQPQNGQ